MDDIIIAILILAFLVVLVMIPNIKILAPNSVMIVERLGFFHRIIRKPGVHILIPLFERVPQVVSLEKVHKKIVIKENTEEHIITFEYQVINPKLFVYAALDAEKELITFIKNNFLIHRDLYNQLLEDITNYAVTLGIELLRIDFNNI